MRVTTRESARSIVQSVSSLAHARLKGAAVSTTPLWLKFSRMFSPLGLSRFGVKSPFGTSSVKIRYL